MADCAFFFIGSIEISSGGAETFPVQSEWSILAQYATDDKG